MNWDYIESNGRYEVEGAYISYTNFAGNANDMNTQGRRNFKLRLDEELYNTLCEQGVQATMRPPRNDGEDPIYSVKVNVYPSTKVFILEDGKTRIPYEDLKMIDDEVMAGTVANGEIDISFHVSLNTTLSRPSYYIRADEIYIPIRKSRFDRKYENYGRRSVDDDDLPM